MSINCNVHTEQQTDNTVMPKRHENTYELQTIQLDQCYHNIIPTIVIRFTKRILGPNYVVKIRHLCILNFYCNNIKKSNTKCHRPIIRNSSTPDSEESKQ